MDRRMNRWIDEVYWFSTCKFNRVTEHFGRQIDDISKIVRRRQRSVLASIVRVEGEFP